jgi:sialate O-acetylesterase
MRKILYLLIFLIFYGCQNKSVERLQLPSLISSGMVLQQNTKVSIFGTTIPFAKVKITSSWGKRKIIRADKNGKWLTKLKTSKAGGPYELSFQTKDTSIVIKDVLVGEVWLCSGQSNMEMPLCGWPPNDTLINSKTEIASAEFPEIRLFTVPRSISVVPLDSCEGSWKSCSPKTIADFSATAYFFGRKLHQELSVPIGLINSSWGGTPAEAWTNQEYLQQVTGYSKINDSLILAKRQYDSLYTWLNSLEIIDIPFDSTGSYSNLQLHDESIYRVDYDDSKWSEMNLPVLWENSALPDFDGIVWFRKEFELSHDLSGKELLLHLGAIDDMDIVYVNGVKIGEISKPGFWTFSRDYIVPPHLLKKGRNIIAVRVTDTGGGGGIYSSQGIRLIYSSHSEPVVDLNGNWKFMPVVEIMNGKFYKFGEEKKSFSYRPILPMFINANTPTVLYNGMINPLISYTLKGVIWYQGEANVSKAFEYRTLFPKLIECWRKLWNLGNFPFYYVQIAPFIYGEKEPSRTAELREAQLFTLKVPNTGMVVTTDIGNPSTIHPGNKQEVGRRLALWALANTYGYDSIEYSGPLYDTFEIKDNKIIVYFKHIEGGLKTSQGNLTNFEIAGNDSLFHPARAFIEGNTVVVWSDKVVNPVSARFGWDQAPEPNLFNDSGLPASPFRTDNWKRLTQYNQ